MKVTFRIAGSKHNNGKHRSHSANVTLASEHLFWFVRSISNKNVHLSGWTVIHFFVVLGSFPLTAFHSFAHVPSSATHTFSWLHHHVSVFYSLFRVFTKLFLQAGLNFTNITRLLNNIPSEFAHCMFFRLLMVLFFSFPCFRMAHSAAPSSSPFMTNFYEPTSPPNRQLQSASLADTGKSTNAPTRSSPPATLVHDKTESPSSSSTSLPRPRLYDHKGAGDLKTVSYGSTEFDRSRTVSAGSSEEGHGMRSTTKRSEAPRGERLTPRASPHASPLPTHFATGSIPTQSITSAASSPTSSMRPTHLAFPAFDGPHPASPSGSSFSTRRPSLASPLPPTPIVPSTPFPKAAFHPAVPAPLNLSSSSLPSATQIRHSHHHPTASASLSSPQHSPPQYKNSIANTTTTTTPPVAASSQTQGQGWSYPQYINVPRPPNTGASTLPDSPSTRAMMKRLLAKPAPISSSHLSATSGSESEAVSSHSHTHTRRKEASSFSTPRKGAMSDGNENFHDREKIFVGDGTAGLEFDMDIDLLGQNIVSMGQWVGTQSDRYFERALSPAPLPEEPKEKEKEKRPRNVLRRRPSANKSTSHLQSPPPSSSPSGPSHQPIISSQGPFSSLSLSPFFRPSHEPKSVQPQNSASNTHALGRTSHPHLNHLNTTSTTMRRAASASVAVPHSSSLHPPLPSGSSHSPSSRGSSPARSPIVSTLVPGTPSPTKTTEAVRRSPSPLAASSSERARAGDRENEKGRVPAVTPAASLIEAYKRREREKEAQRIVIERMKGRQLQLLKDDKGSKEAGDSTPTTGTNTPTPTNRTLLLGGEARSKSTPPSGGNSFSTPAMSIIGDRINVQKRSSPTAEKEIDGVEKSGSGNRSIGSLNLGSSYNIDHDRPAVVTSGRSEDSRSPSKTPQPVSLGPAVVRRGLEDTVAKPAPHSRPHASGDVIPYYTVFGSASGRIVAVGSPEDSNWNTYDHGYWDSNILGPRNAISTGLADNDKGKSKESLGRSLSRKLSGRLKKQGGHAVGTPDREDGSREERIVSRSSMQERRKEGSTARRDEDEEEKRMRMRNRRSLRLSIDKFSDVVGKEFDERLMIPPRLAKNGDGSLAEVRDVEDVTRLSKATRTDGGSPGPGGSRFWKLIRRISAGTLKDKYHDTEPPPPVPALPRDLQNLHLSRSNDSSLTCQRQMPASVCSSPSPRTPVTTIPPKSRPLPSSPPGSNQPRQSTTTRSSSPVSSDVASSKFFHRNHSAHSSTSSFAEDHNPPPLPSKPPQFAQHIIDPSELSKTAEEGTRSPTRTQPPRNIPIPSQRMDDDWSIVRSPSVELPSLPLPPPRRPAVNLNSFGGKVTELDRPESPTIPSFSTNDAVNAFPSRRLSATLSARSRNSPSSTHSPSSSTIAQSSSSPTSLPPPPRPLRSKQRPPPPIVVIDDIPAGRKSESHARVQHNRRSSGGLSSASTARPFRRRSSSIGGTISSHQSISPPGSAVDTMFTFRELDDSAGPKRYALTEQEKAEKWDDLMERSARAGGTLHLAADARVLASDRLK